jgi:hypothetical protein
MEPPDHLDVGAGGEEAVDRRVLAGDADPGADLRRICHHVEPGDAGVARGRQRERGEDADGRRLARAVVAQQPEDGTRGDVQIEVAERVPVAVALAQPAGDDAGRL